METGLPKACYRGRLRPLKPSLVEWKPVQGVYDIRLGDGLETFLSGMETLTNELVSHGLKVP